MKEQSDGAIEIILYPSSQLGDYTLTYEDLMRGSVDMGFSETTISYADLYTALQTGVVDGWTGGMPQLNYTDFKDVINHYVHYNMFAENIGFL